MISAKKVILSTRYFWFLLGNDNSFLIGRINFYEAKNVMSHGSYTSIFCTILILTSFSANIFVLKRQNVLALPLTTVIYVKIRNAYLD